MDNSQNPRKNSKGFLNWVKYKCELASGASGEKLHSDNGKEWGAIYIEYNGQYYDDHTPLNKLKMPATLPLTLTTYINLPILRNFFVLISFFVLMENSSNRLTYWVEKIQIFRS